MNDFKIRFFTADPQIQAFYQPELRVLFVPTGLSENEIERLSREVSHAK